MLGDCMDVMKSIGDSSVDLVLCDPPYGMTSGRWDAPLPLDRLWRELGRVCKPDATVCLFACQPYATALINSNLDGFRYCWYWLKNQATNFFHARRMPMRRVEEICVFGKGGRYNPQIKEGCVPTRPAKGCSNGRCYYGRNRRDYKGGSTSRYPNNVLEFRCVSNYGRIHPNQKPVGLLSYLIRTYTSKGDSVLDFCMGSGSTGIACFETGRDFTGIEMDPVCFAAAKARIDKAMNAPRQLLLFETSTEGTSDDNQKAH